MSSYHIDPLPINTVLPSDFTKGGRFEHIELPFFIPIPEEILNYIFGPDHGPIHYRTAMKILKSLHEMKGQDINYCGCGRHIMSKRTIPIDIPEGREMVG